MLGRQTPVLQPDKPHDGSAIVRFTVDVSDVVPVMVGQKKEWFTK